jgi:hypothetical protein
MKCLAEGKSLIIPQLRTILMAAVAVMAIPTIAQTERRLHVTKVVATERTGETFPNGNTSMGQTFTVDAHDEKNDYHADCKDTVLFSKDNKLLVHYHCVQVESGEDYDVTFFPNASAFSFKCEKCAETETDRYLAYEIRSQEERKAN